MMSSDQQGPGTCILYYSKELVKFVGRATISYYFWDAMEHKR